MEINSNYIEILKTSNDLVRASKEVDEKPSATGTVIDDADIKIWRNNENI